MRSRKGNEKKTSELEGKWVLRLYDMFDGWMDVSDPVSKEEAEALWLKETSGGTKMTQYADGDYYKVFPANTKMLHTPEFRGR